MASEIMNHPRLVSVSDPSGTSLTTANIVTMTPDVIEGMNMTAYMEDIWGAMTTSRAVGCVANTLDELLTSRIAQVSKSEIAQRKIGRTTQFAPFKYRGRERNYKMSYFSITSGEANADAGTGDVPNSAWDINVNIGLGDFDSSLKYLARYFIPGQQLVVEFVNDISNVAYTSVFKIYASEDVDEDNATVTVVAPFNNADWTALSAGNKAPYQPEFGTIQILANNISDWESFCVNAPTNNNQEMVVDWFQTSRFTSERTLEGEKYLAEIMNGNVNEYLKRFRNLPETVRNKQEQMYWNQGWLNSVFYSQRINQYQTDDPTWADILKLEVVSDPEDGTEYERKAGAIGIHTQMVENGRRVDLQGAALNLDTLLDLLWVVQRNRKLDGKPHDVIDLMTDRFTKHNLDVLLTKYLTLEYGMQHVRYVNEGQVLDGSGATMYRYTKYELHKWGLTLAIFTHDFFNDRISAFAGDNVHRGSMIQVLDYEDIIIGLLETNSVYREFKNEITAQANPIYTRRMKINTHRLRMDSRTWDVEIGDHNRHLIVENFSTTADPTITLSTAAPA